MFGHCLIFLSFVAWPCRSMSFVREPDDVQTIIGSTVLLPCRTEPIDGNQVTWCKNDFCTLGKTRDLPSYPRYEIIGDALKGEHHFKIVNVSLDDMGTYQCQIRAGPRRAGAMSRKMKLTVLQMPTSLTIDNPVVVVENVLSFVVCRANNGMPEAKLSWHLPKSISYLSKNDYALLSDQSLRNSISNLTFVPSRSFHGQLIRCQAHSAALDINNQSLITEQYIHTIYAPELNMSITGETIEDHSIVVHCRVSSRPAIDRIRWFNGSVPLHGSNSSRLSLHLTRFMHGNRIFCQATNSVAQRNQSLVLQVNYKPVFVNANNTPISNYSVVVVEGDEPVDLVCLVDSFPRPSISWFFHDELLVSNRSSLTLANRTGVFTCRVDHSLFGTFDRTVRVTPAGPPEMIDETTVHSVVVGEDVQFVCSISTDLPVDDRWWSREGHGKLSPTDRYELNTTHGDRLIESRLLIKSVVSADEDSYLCTTRNQFGSSLIRFQLHVRTFQGYLLQRVLLYASILLGLTCCLLLLLLSFVHHCRSNNHDRHSRKRSSTTDETISSLAKQHDDIHSHLDQYLFHEQFTIHQRQDFNESIEDEPFDLQDNLDRFSTVV